MNLYFTLHSTTLADHNKIMILSHYTECMDATKNISIVIDISH